MQALCCVCGNQRTVNSDYSRYQDPNNSHSTEGKAQGWRKTESLKCDACGVRTRHALLNPDDKYRDYDEMWQLIALGDDAPFDWAGEDYLRKLRADYRQQFPRNPNLKHRYWVKEAKAAWDHGTKQVIALCGEPMTIESDPIRPSKKVETPGQLVAEQLSDTEYEDPETGLWWIDMDCVDCCRVSNRKHWEAQRKRLEYLLAWFARHPEEVPDAEVDGLSVLMERLVCLRNGVEP